MGKVRSWNHRAADRKACGRYFSCILTDIIYDVSGKKKG